MRGHNYEQGRPGHQGRRRVAAFKRLVQSESQPAACRAECRAADIENECQQ